MTIQVDYDAPFFALTFPFNKYDLERVRSLPVAKWNKPKVQWEVPRLAVKSLSSLDANWTSKARKAEEWINKSLLKLVDAKFDEGQEHEILRPYQTVGVNFLTLAKKALLADDMGLGKSIQSITAAMNANVFPILVLCPASLKYKWQNEFMKHYGIETVVVAGDAATREIIWESDKIKFFIANYELLLHDWDVMPKEWGVIIADEAVYLKNPQAKRTKAAKKLKSEYKFALSGMYVENSLTEFQSIMEFVRPEVIPSAYKFKKNYCELDWAGNVLGPNKETIPEIHALTSPFILRREKVDVLKELPPKIYHDTPIEMTATEKEGYAKLSKAFIDWLESDEEAVTSWDGTLSCREFVEFPTMVDKFSKWAARPSKLTWLDDLYSEVDKLVVFTFFKRSADALAEHFKTPYLISGDVDTDDRFKISEEFNKAEKAVLVSTDAGRFGLDFIGADNVVHYGQVYNPASVLQREDRLHRFGQTKGVNVFTPYLRGTIDEGIMKIMKQRLDQAKGFMEDSDVMASLKLSTADFKKLIMGEDILI